MPLNRSRLTSACIVVCSALVLTSCAHTRDSRPSREDQRVEEQSPDTRRGEASDESDETPSYSEAGLARAYALDEDAWLTQEVAARYESKGFAGVLELMDMAREAARTSGLDSSRLESRIRILLEAYIDGELEDDISDAGVAQAMELPGVDRKAVLEAVKQRSRMRLFGGDIVSLDQQAETITDAYDKGVEKQKKKEEKQAEMDRSQHFQLTAGIFMLNPYEIEENDMGELVIDSDGDTDVRAFIESTFQYRRAWLPEKREHFKDGVDTWWIDWVPDDYEFRLGLVATGGDGESAGTVTPGAGDAYGEVGVGYQLFRVLGNDSVQNTFNIEGLYGFTTDIGAQDIHDYLGIGVASVWSIKNVQDRMIQIFFGAYAGRVETPAFANDDDLVIEQDRGLAEFDDEFAITFRGDVHIPVLKTSYVSLSGRFHQGFEDLNPWSISLGYTIPFATLMGLAKGDSDS